MNMRGLYVSAFTKTIIDVAYLDDLLRGYGVVLGHESEQIHRKGDNSGIYKVSYNVICEREDPTEKLKDELIKKIQSQKINAEILESMEVTVEELKSDHETVLKGLRSEGIIK